MDNAALQAKLAAKMCIRDSHILIQFAGSQGSLHLPMLFKQGDLRSYIPVSYTHLPTAVITGDTDGSILCALHDYIRPALMGMDVMDLPACMEKLNACMVHNTTPKAAVDMALYDLWAKAQKKPSNW